MKINKKTGIIDGVTFIRSPNADERPAASPADLIVVHNISLPPGEFGGPYIGQLFSNQLNAAEHPYFEEIYQLKVSSHALIRRDGEVIQFVPFHQRAWHAGESNYCGREKCNDFSIGIELEGTDDIAYEDVQYSQLADMITSLCNTYTELSTQAITGHCDIAPQRKTDPGPSFDWSRLNKLLNN